MPARAAPGSAPASGESPSSAATQSATTRLSQHRLRLTVLAGADRGATADVVAARVTIGSAPASDLRLGDAAVSRHHCEIVARDDLYVLRDLGAPEGTYLEDVRVFEAPILPGATLRVGATLVRFEPSRSWVELPASEATRFGDLVGGSTVMRRAFTLLEKVAGSSLTCLLVGETGTGKEIAARAVHARSPRAAGPFVIIDCGAVNENLVEAELFGHERGAFTGADRSRAGSFERAHGGTIFLDEIGELPIELQPKLLRVLERREVCRIGASVPLEVDVRVVAATHRDLAEMVDRGTFREDLLYRLAEMVVTLPALREHAEDLPLLADRILEAIEGPARSLSADAAAWLAEQPWPGNVRELRNLLRRAAALSAAPVIDRRALEQLDPVRRSSRPPPLLGPPPLPGGLAPPLREVRRAGEREYLLGLLARHGADLPAAAAEAGLHRKSLERLLRRHGLGRRS